MVRSLLKFYNNRKAGENSLHQKVFQITGFIPGNLLYYKIALTHRSSSQNISIDSQSNNERLEYLGDAILGAVIADFLFLKFPGKGEGFLTKMRANIVNRSNLNRIAIKMGIDSTMHDNTNCSQVKKHIFGNTLEAFIGAVYLDKGYKKTKRFIVRKIINNHVNLKEILNTDKDYKSRLLRWAQKNNSEVSFPDIRSDTDCKSVPLFTATLHVSGICAVEGKGGTKKEAQQDACKQALNIITPQNQMLSHQSSYEEKNTQTFRS